jgi:2'-5' RNA ligase
LNTVRLFWAIRPPRPELNAATRVLHSLSAPCLRAGLKVAWVDASSLHITLKYLSVVPAAQIGALVEAVRQALGARTERGCPRLTLGGIGAFPSREQPAVLFIEVGEVSDVRPVCDIRDVSGQTAPTLAALQAEVEEAMTRCGYAKDTRPYHPHLTLGRVRDRKRPGDAEGLAQIFASSTDQRCGGPFLATELTLYESRPTAAGVQYLPLVGVSVENPGAPAEPLS